MPVRSQLQPLEPAGPDPLELFLAGDGTRAHFADTVPYPDKAAACRAWNRRGIRRAVWAAAQAGTLPGGAIAHDGLTRRGFETLWRTMQADRFSLRAVLSEVERDRAAVAAFEAAQPRAAREIARFLPAWRRQLDRVEQAARLRERGGINRLREAIDLVMAGPATYGDTEVSE